MTPDLQIRFQLGNSNHSVAFEKPNAQDQESVLIGGVRYSLRGNQEAINFVKNCFAQLPSNSTTTLEQTGKELKARLWLAGAKEIRAINQIGLEILGTPHNLSATVNEICSAVDKYYVFPDIAKKCSEHLRRQLAEGAYDAINDPETLAQALTADLRQISEDKHIWIDFHGQETAPVEEPVPEQYSSPSMNQVYTFKAKSEIGWMGGTQASLPYEVKSGYLSDNPKIGFIDLRIFGVCMEKDPDPKIAELEQIIKKADPSEIPHLEKQLQDLKKADEWDLQQDVAARRAALKDAVLNLKNAESIIIDLRSNGGGHPTAVQLLCSMLMKENIPLNRIESRQGDQFVSKDFRTLTNRELPERERLLQPTVYVLIGPRTFSAAEEFTNNLKVSKRATIVGEPSGGGAHPGDVHDIGKDFTIFIPYGRAVNPIQQGNWEGVGIIPDHMVPAQEAFEQALRLI